MKEREKAMNLHTQRKSHSYFKISALGTRNIMGIHGHSDCGYYHTNGRMVDPRFFYDLTTPLRLQDTLFAVLREIATARSKSVRFLSNFQPVHAKYAKVVKLTNNKIM